MQYIQLQGQVAANLDLPIEGSYNLFIDTSDNSIKAKDSDGHMHGGGGLSLTELTRDEIGDLVASASLTPGAFYKITGAASQSFLDANGFGWNNWNNGTYTGGGNEIQDGGTTIILQATTDKTLSKKGIGLFYVPNYENPNFPTLPPDTNFNTWDNTHRIYLASVSGRFRMGEYVQLYSNETDLSAYGYLEGSLHGSGSGDITFRLQDSDANFFQNSNNLIGLEVRGQYDNAIGYIDGWDYITSYTSGSCVVYGGRVWQSRSGSIGYKDGSWPDEELYLNVEDWRLVPFDETHYTIKADAIEYEFEYDNISYRSDGVNEVYSDWRWWDDNWGYNMIKFFPWGHYGVERCSFSNSYLSGFVNFPYDAHAWNIKFEDGGGFNAHTWGKQSNFRNIQGEKGAHFTGHDFGNGTDIYDIKLGVNSSMHSIKTCDNSYGDYSQIYEVTLGNNAYFGDFKLYYATYIEYVEIGTNAGFDSFTMYEYSRIRNVNCDINSYFGQFYLWNSSEIKSVKLGINSYIQNFDLYYSSCLKRTTIGTDAWMYNFSVGVNSFIRQVNLSERAYIQYFDIGDYSNLQNIDLGAYAYMYNFNGGYSTDFQNIRLDASARIYNVYLGYDSVLSEIQIAPHSRLYNINSNNNPSPFTSSYVQSISLGPWCTMTGIDMGSYSYVQSITLQNDSWFGSITLEEGAGISDVNFMGDNDNGGLLIASGSSIQNFQIGITAGFGEMAVTSSAILNRFELGNGDTFGGTTISSSLSDVTLTKGFKNLYNTETFTGVSGSSLTADYGGNASNLPYLNIDGRGVVVLDITGTPAETVNYRLNSGQYEGQEIKFVVRNTFGTVYPASTDVRVWCDDLQYPFQFNELGYVQNCSFAPFAHYDASSSAWVWRTMGRATWTNGMWVADAEYYYD